MGLELQLARRVLAHSTLVRVPYIALLVGSVVLIAAAVSDSEHLEHTVIDSSCATVPSTGAEGDGSRQTPLSVKVLATIEAVDPAQSLAQVSAPGRGIWTAAVGDSLGPGAVVTAIGSGEVTYEHRGTRTRLRLGT